MKLLLAVLLLPFTESFASNPVINSNSAKTYNTVVEIGGSSICTGAVVGLNPPTIITARHCVENNVQDYSRNFDLVSPDQIIIKEFKTQQFDKKSALPGDIAVLVFSQPWKVRYFKDIKTEDLFTISPGIQLSHKQRVELCGFGRTTQKMSYESGGEGIQRCGFNQLIEDRAGLDYQLKFQTIEAAYPNVRFEELPHPIKVMRIHSVIKNAFMVYGAGTRLAIAKFAFDGPGDVAGQYDSENTQSLINGGDSGGPLFVTEQNKKILIGVASMGIYHRPYEYDQTIFGGIYWSINSEWTLEFLKEAVAKGADISGLKKPKSP